MAAPLGKVQTAVGNDPRCQTGAYITNGTGLYEVIGTSCTPGVMGMTVVYVELENCFTLTSILVLPSKVREGFVLVRAAPVAYCPDSPDQIPEA